MTQFRDGFMMKSPLPKHQQKFYDKARELSEKSGTPGDYNRDDPKVNEQLDLAEEAEKSHGSASPLEAEVKAGAYASGGGGAKYVSILPHIQKLQNDLEGMAAKGGKINQEKSMEKAIAADDDFMSSGPGKDMSQSGVEDRLGLKKEKKISTKPLNIDTDFDDLIEFDEAQ